MQEEKNTSPVIIMNGLNNEQTLKVMKAVKSIEGIPRIIFASTTQTSLEWKVKDLLQELKAEDDEFRKMKEKE